MRRTEFIKVLHYTTGQPCEIRMAEGRIIAVRQGLDSNDDIDSLSYAAPGLVDLQINGYAGMDFNLHPLAPGLTQEVAKALGKEGVTSFLPTVITNKPDRIQAALCAIARDCQEDVGAARAVAGIHLEGPFISPDDGARGAHPLAEVRPPDWDLFCRWQEAANGMIRLLTLSPEWPNSQAFIERCSASGVTVSIGHTAASTEQIAAAVGAGARMSTHLGNGAHLQLPRHPNYLWEQLAQEDLWACVIADGFHLPDQVLKVVMKVKGERALLVSDSVALCGMPPGEYETPVGGGAPADLVLFRLYGGRIIVDKTYRAGVPVYERQHGGGKE